MTHHVAAKKKQSQKKYRESLIGFACTKEDCFMTLLFYPNDKPFRSWSWHPKNPTLQPTKCLKVKASSSASASSGTTTVCSYGKWFNIARKPIKSPGPAMPQLRFGGRWAFEFWHWKYDEDLFSKETNQENLKVSRDFYLWGIWICLQFHFQHFCQVACQSICPSCLSVGLHPMKGALRDTHAVRTRLPSAPQHRAGRNLREAMSVGVGRVVSAF